LVNVLDRDLELVKLSKCDKCNWTVRAHGSRHSLATSMNRGNGYPRVAQAAMRPSNSDLTMSLCTVSKPFDVARALDTLPGPPIEHEPKLALEGA
jgi:hypothetical protein